VPLVQRVAKGCDHSLEMNLLFKVNRCMKTFW